MDPTSDKILPYLTYDVYVFTEAPTTTLLLYFNMTLDLDPTDPMNYDMLVDGDLVQTQRLVSKAAKAGELPDGWISAVQECAWVRKHVLAENSFRPGKHTIQLRLRHSNMILEKLVVDLGGTKESYLGPPSSFYIQNM